MIRRAATSAGRSVLAAASKSRLSDCSFQSEPPRPYRYRNVDFLCEPISPLDSAHNVKYKAFERSSSLQSSSSSSTKMDDNDKFFLYHSNCDNRLLTPISLQDDGSLSANKFPMAPLFKEKDGVSRIKNCGIYCCYGVFCYPVGDDDVFVWNPTTSETRKLPDSPFTPAPGVTKTAILTATWADPKSEDYKVIRFFSFSWTDTEAFEVRRCVEIELYSLKSDSWKKMIEGELPLPLCVNDLPLRVYGHCYTNGVIHISHFVEIRPSFILSFDFRSETFSNSPIPKLAAKFYYRLLNYNGQPSILTMRSEGIRENDERDVKDKLLIYGVYVMRKNGEWDYVGEYLVNAFYHPLGFARNGELLLLQLMHPDFEQGVMKTKLGVFDSTTGEVKHVPGVSYVGEDPLLFQFHETFVKLKPPAPAGEQGGTEEDGLTTEAVM